MKLDIPSARVRNGTDSSSRVSPRRTDSGSFAARCTRIGESVSCRFFGSTEQRTSSAPDDSALATRSKNFTRSSGVLRTSAARYAVSLMPSSAMSLSMNSEPSFDNVALVDTLTALCSAVGTGDVRRVSPSGRQTM